MVETKVVLLMVVGPIFLGYAMQVAEGRWALPFQDGYLISFAFGLALAVKACWSHVNLQSAQKNLRWINLVEQISSHAFQIVSFLSIGFFVFWTLVLWATFGSFNLDVIDSGIYSNIVFNTSQGQLFYSSFHKINALGEHFSPIMLAFVPFFWISPNILWLLVAQAAAFSVCPVILFFICREIIKKENIAGPIAVAATVLWFAFPSLLNAVKTGFHPSTLSLPFIFAAGFSCSGQLAVVSDDLASHIAQPFRPIHRSVLEGDIITTMSLFPCCSLRPFVALHPLKTSPVQEA